MSENGPLNNATEAELRQTIARQAEEIQRLQGRLDAEHLASELRAALILTATTGTIAAPVTHSHLLEMIVEVAAQVIPARAASLFLIDQSAQELVFEVALGEKAGEVAKFRVPLGHGVAGLVAVTGQAMAISDAAGDPRQAADIAQAVGYVPQSILCVPLFYQDQITGVLELLDKEGAPSFTPADMELLGLFANQAAVAIELSQTHRNLAALLLQAIASGREESGDGQAALQGRVHDFVASLETDETYRRASHVARLVQEIAQRGDNEARACATILRGFADYLSARPDPLEGIGMAW